MGLKVNIKRGSIGMMTSSSKSNTSHPPPLKASPAPSDPLNTTKKKRTFDIAFLTGQNENNNALSNNENNNNATESNKEKEIKEDKNRLKRKVISYLQEDSICSSSSEACSMIDVLTNGSLSDEEQEEETPLPLTAKRTLKGSGPLGSGALHFESRRTIDINHSSESVIKIKENVHFSSNTPIYSHPHNAGASHNAAASSPFTHLFPTLLQVQAQASSKQFTSDPYLQNPYPLPLPLHAANKIRFQHHQAEQYAASIAAAAASMAQNGYAYPNLILSNQDFSSSQRHSQFSPPNAATIQNAGIQNAGSQNPNTGQQQNQNMSSGGGVTLLPPSLTALTLPAQNVCAKCNIGFRMTSDLVYHMRSHHKRDTFDPLKKQREEKLKCPVCHESFRERHHLTRHMTAHQDRKEEAQEALANSIGSGTQPPLPMITGIITGSVVNAN